MIHNHPCLFPHRLCHPLGHVDELQAVHTVHGVTGVLGVKVPGDDEAIAIGKQSPAIVGPVKRRIWRILRV